MFKSQSRKSPHGFSLSHLLNFSLVFLLSTFILGCGDDDDDPSTPPPAEISVTSVTISMINPLKGSTQYLMHKGMSTQYQAIAHFSDGTTLDVTKDQAAWVSTHPENVSIDTCGLTTAVKIGPSDISAEYESIRSNLFNVTVDEAAVDKIVVSADSYETVATLKQQFTAELHFTDATSQTVTNGVTWIISNDVVATINEDGIASAHSKGVVQITASIDTVTSAAVDFTVHAIEIDAVTIITTESGPIAAGLSRTYTALVHLSNGKDLDITNAAQWNSSNEAFASIVKGVATSHAMGSVQISAEIFSSTSQELTLEVSDAEVTSIAITSSNGNEVPAGLSSQFTAEATYTTGETKPINNADLYWTSSDNETLTVDSNGFMKALKLDSATVQASFKEINTSQEITVTNAIVESMVITADTDTVIPEGFTYVQAIATMSNSATQTMTSQVAWSSSIDGIVSLSAVDWQNEKVTGLVDGSTVITASIDGVTASLTLHVDNARELDLNAACTDAIVNITGYAMTCPATLIEANAMHLPSQGSDSYNITRFTYQGALNYCEALVVGGRDDWALPPVERLRTLLIESDQDVKATHGWPESVDRYRTISTDTGIGNQHYLYDIVTGERIYFAGSDSGPNGTVSCAAPLNL
ncbi:MAG: Ig-like domain-containing protein [Pseudomonadales bacterium]|nr:Ig-like domain-containing protein [Pseudomonadales bacterium]